MIKEMTPKQIKEEVEKEEKFNTKEELYKSIRILKNNKIIDGEVAMQMNSMVFNKFRKEIIESLPLGIIK